ncbi:MAG: hypothetical protein WC788_04970 [Candidatus Paceibacterota bacterium]
MSNTTYALKIIEYKLVPMIITWAAALALLVYTNSIIIRENFWDATTTVGGLIIIIVAAYITMKILDHVVKE